MECPDLVKEAQSLQMHLPDVVVFVCFILSLYLILVVEVVVEGVDVVGVVEVVSVIKTKMQRIASSGHPYMGISGIP